jgi:hypothetical protein
LSHLRFGVCEPRVADKIWSHNLLISLTLDLGLDGRPGGNGAKSVYETGGCFDRPAIDANDYVTLLESRLGRRRLDGHDHNRVLLFARDVFDGSADFRPTHQSFIIVLQ